MLRFEEANSEENVDSAFGIQSGANVADELRLAARWPTLESASLRR